MRSHDTLLLIEDDEVDILTVRRALRELGSNCTLLVAKDGLEALDILRDSTMPRPSLVLLDLNMPRMNGLEMLRAARDEELLTTTPVVVLTTSAHERDVVEGFNLAISGYMVKPVDFRKFVEVFRVIDSYWTLSELPV
ncbi:MAG: response regulator [Acidobacteriota bacterium]